MRRSEVYGKKPADALPEDAEARVSPAAVWRLGLLVAKSW
jgi:hypothetical protein